MFCCDKGISLVPDMLFKVSKLAVTLFWFSAKEKRKAAYSNSLTSNNLSPFENAALHSIRKNTLSKVLSFNIW